MDEEIRHLQRLASINDPEAKDKLFNLIRRLGLPPEFGLNRDLRPYRCTFCGHEKKLSTNHTSLIYSIYCDGCSWKGMRDEFGDYHQPSGRTFAYAGYELGEGQRSCNCSSCRWKFRYRRNPITPHRLNMKHAIQRNPDDQKTNLAFYPLSTLYSRALGIPIAESGGKLSGGDIRRHPVDPADYYSAILHNQNILSKMERGDLLNYTLEGSFFIDGQCTYYAYPKLLKSLLQTIGASTDPLSQQIYGDYLIAILDKNSTYAIRFPEKAVPVNYLSVGTNIGGSGVQTQYLANVISKVIQLPPGKPHLQLEISIHFTCENGSNDRLAISAAVALDTEQSINQLLEEATKVSREKVIENMSGEKSRSLKPGHGSISPESLGSKAGIDNLMMKAFSAAIGIALIKGANPEDKRSTWLSPRAPVPQIPVPTKLFVLGEVGRKPLRDYQKISCLCGSTKKFSKCCMPLLDPERIKKILRTYLHKTSCQQYDVGKFLEDPTTVEPEQSVTQEPGVTQEPVKNLSPKEAAIEINNLYKTIEYECTQGHWRESCPTRIQQHRQEEAMGVATPIAYQGPCTCLDPKITGCTRYLAKKKHETAQTVVWSTDLVLSKDRKTAQRPRDRDTKMAKGVKIFYEHICQMCQRRLISFDGLPYAEAAHIIPFGKPYMGPDEPSNIIILCAEHHTEFDLGLISVQLADQGFMIQHQDTNNSINGKILRVLPGHQINPKFFHYHDICVRSKKSFASEPCQELRKTISKRENSEPHNSRLRRYYRNPKYGVRKNTNLSMKRTLFSGSMDLGSGGSDEDWKVIHRTKIQ